ncbi:MAG: hypothetical protein ACI8Z1_001554 [Candidatus Azotimanducaceae bacterium]
MSLTPSGRRALSVADLVRRFKVEALTLSPSVSIIAEIGNAAGIPEHSCQVNTVPGHYRRIALDKIIVETGTLPVVASIAKGQTR